VFVHFEAAGDRIGLCLEHVSEIARISRVTPVPRAPDPVLGLANIRGRVVTLLDAERLFGGSAAPAEGGGHAVVLAAPRDHLAVFTRASVDIGKGRESEGGAAADLKRDPAVPVEALAVMGEEVVRLYPPSAIERHCESQVMERYRRRA
jgi:hypothetical protein